MLRRSIILSISTLVVAIGVAVLVSPVHAVGRAQYMAIPAFKPSENVADAAAVQKLLDKASAEGWEFAGSVEQVLIFKK